MSAGKIPAAPPSPAALTARGETTVI
jgi:hypothetical protein